MSEPSTPDADTTEPDSSSSSGPLIITALVIGLLILHQDNWLWENDTLVFGFIPIGLFFHACISIAATATWFLATKIAWPIDDTEVKSNVATGSNANQGAGQ